MDALILLKVAVLLFSNYKLSLIEESRDREVLTYKSTNLKTFKFTKLLVVYFATSLWLLWLLLG